MFLRYQKQEKYYCWRVQQKTASLCHIAMLSREEIQLPLAKRNKVRSKYNFIQILSLHKNARPNFDTF